MKNKNTQEHTQRLVFSAMLFAIAIVLAVIENAIPPLIVIAPGVKLGLSNIAVMYAMLFVGTKEAYSIAILKVGFVFLTRGAVASLFSLCGGVLSLTIMLIIILLFKNKASYITISIFGAIFHNLGQFIAVSLVYTSLGVWAYLPILMISGVIAGIITATLMRIVMPAFKEISTRLYRGDKS